MATVVVVLCSTPVVSSMPMLRSVSSSSVCSGRISLTAPTSVVLPTPNPPATRSFTARGMSAAPCAASECFESMEYFPKQMFAERPVLLYGTPDHDQPVVEQITEQYTDHHQGEVQLRRYLRDRQRPDAQLEDGEMLRPHAGGRERCRPGGRDDRDHLETLASGGLGTAARQCVRPDERAGLVVEPFVSRTGHQPSRFLVGLYGLGAPAQCALTDRRHHRTEF